VPSESVKDWSITPGNNNPQGGDVIGNTLDDELREIKAIVRQESLNKQWERWNLSCSYVSAASFKIQQPQNQPWGPTGAGVAVVGRKVRISHEGHPVVFASIRTVTENVASGGLFYTVCEITPEFSGTLYSDLSEVQFGALTPNGNSLPATIRGTQKNPFFTSTLEITGTQGSTWQIKGTFPDLTNHPKSGEVYYVQANWDNASTVNPGSIYFGLYNGTSETFNYFPIVRLTLAAYTTATSPEFIELTVGDVRKGQTLALMYDTSTTTPRWQLLSPPATIPTFLEIAALFAVADSTVTETVNADVTNCYHQGYLTVFKKYVIQWALVRPIPVNGNRIITLPKNTGVMQILAVLATTVDLQASSPVYVNTVSATQIQAFNPNPSHALPVYVLVIARLNS
jgi:hypothetical protein